MGYEITRAQSFFFISQTHNLLNEKVREIKTCVCASTAEWGSLLFSSLKNLVNH